MQHTFDEFDNNGSTVFVCTEAWLGQVLKIEAMQGSAAPFLTQVHRAHRKAGFEPTHYICLQGPGRPSTSCSDHFENYQKYMAYVICITLTM